MVMLSAMPKFNSHSSTVSGRKPVATMSAAAIPAAAVAVLATAHGLAGVRIWPTDGAKPVAKRTASLAAPAAGVASTAPVLAHVVPLSRSVRVAVVSAPSVRKPVAVVSTHVVPTVNKDVCPLCASNGGDEMIQCDNCD
jgi:hypothetical protein